MRVHSNLHSFEERSSIYSWLTRIAINSALMILRKKRIRSEVPMYTPMDDSTETLLFDTPDLGPSPEQTCEMRQRERRALTAIQTLDPGLRNVIRLQAVHEQSMEEIGRALRISVAAAKSRLHRARKRVRARTGLGAVKNSKTARRH
jgi:RNA polymerase sigma-70 factor (ECF subfamily)